MSKNTNEIKSNIWKILEKVYDPEIPIDVVNLGLIYGVDVIDDKVVIKMTLTAPGCPLAEYVAQLVEESVRTEMPEIKDVKVEVVWDPPWTPRRITEKGRKILQELYGRDIVQEWIERMG